MYFTTDNQVDLSWYDITVSAKSLTHTSNPTRSLSTEGVDAIVGIYRGGIIPATMLSHQLRLTMFIIDSSSRRQNSSSLVFPYPFDSEHHKNLLVVDDLTDTGYTLQKIKAELSKRHNVTTATIIHKPESVFTPDYTNHVLPPESGWVNFPWEIESIGNTLNPTPPPSYYMYESDDKRIVKE